MYSKRIFEPIISHLRKLFRRSPPSQAAVREEQDQTPQIAEPPVDEDFDSPRPANSIQHGHPPLPPDCNMLYSGDIEISGTFSACGGRFTNVWHGSLAGEPVAVKSYRLYSTTDSTQARMRFYKEALACSIMLPHRNIVPFRATYTSPEHPLALVYDFVGHRCLGEYSRECLDIKRVRLLVDITRGLLHMHDSGIIHGNLEINNILVDLHGTARIGGLGSAFVPSRSHATWSEIDAGLPFYGTAPEFVRVNLLESGIRTTKESDVYAFALLAWELFAKQVPFSDMHQPAAINLLAGGHRPPRPYHHELSDQVWNVIKTCWHHDPSRRMPIKSVVSALEVEMS